MPEIQSVEQIEEAAKKVMIMLMRIRKMDGVFKYIDLKQVKDLNLVRDEHFQEVPSGEVYYRSIANSK